MRKQFSIFCWAGLYDVTAAQHDAHRLHGWRDGAGLGIDAVGIHAERAANGKNVDGLHGLYRQALFVQKLLELPPARAGLDVYALVSFVQDNAIEIPEIKNQPTMRKSLPAHAVLLTRAGNF